MCCNLMMAMKIHEIHESNLTTRQYENLKIPIT